MLRPGRLALASGLAFMISLPLFLLIWFPFPVWLGWTLYFVAMALFVGVGPALLVAAAVVAWRGRRR